MPSGKVVVSDHLALALDDLEHVVSSALDGLVELDLEIALGVLEVLSNALLHSLSLSLTDGDCTVQSLVQVSLSDSVVVVHDASDASELSLGLLGVLSDSVSQHHDLGLEHALSVSELVRGSHSSSLSGLSESSVSSVLGLLLSSELLVEELGCRGQVLCHLDLVVSVGGTSLVELGVEVGGESSNLVLIHELTQLTTSLLRAGEASVGDALDAHQSLLGCSVDLSLLGLHGHDLSGDLLKLVDELL